MGCCMGLLFFLLGLAWARATDFEELDTSMYRVPPPDANITVSLRADNYQAYDFDFPLWRAAVDGGYEQLENWLRQRRGQPGWVEQDRNSTDYLSQLPRDLLYFIASKCGTSGKSLYVLSLVNSHILFALFPLLKERHWQHEVWFLSRLRIPEESRIYGHVSPHRKLYGVRSQKDNGIRQLGAGYHKTYMCLDLRFELLRFPVQQSFYLQKSTLKHWTFSQKLETVSETLCFHKITGAIDPRSTFNRHNFLMSMRGEDWAARKGLEVDLWSLRLLAPHLLSRPPVIESLQIGDYMSDVKQISPALGALASLKKLHVNVGEMSLPTSVSNLKQLEDLALCCVSPCGLADVLTQLTSLTRLKLWGVKLPQEDLAQTLTALPNLTLLHLMGLNLASVPQELCTLSNLEDLRLDENQLRQLPDDIGALSKLRLLNVSDNQLTTLPVTLFNHVALEEIQADRNALRSLPVLAIRAHRLKRLRAGMTPFKLSISRNDTLSYWDQFLLCFI